jgi:hypothetical protein
MMTSKRRIQSNARAPHAHGIAMAWAVSCPQGNFSPVNAGVMQTL